MGSKQEVKFEGQMVRKDVVEHLRNIIDSIEAGDVHLEADGRHLVLTPTNVMDLRIEGSGKDDKQKLEIRLSWNPAMAAEEKRLRITSNGSGDDDR